MCYTDKNNVPLFYTGCEEQEATEISMSKAEYSETKDNDEDVTENDSQSSLVTDTKTPSIMEKIMAVVCLLLEVSLLYITMFLSEYRNEILYNSVIYCLYMAALPFLLILVIVFLSIYRYRRTLKKQDRIMINPIMNWIPELKRSCILTVLLICCIAGAVYVFQRPDEIVIWLIAALLIVVYLLVVFGFTLRLRDKIILFPILAMIFNLIWTYRLIPPENYTARYLYVSLDGYKGTCDQEEDYFYADAMSMEDFLTSMAYINEKEYLKEGESEYQFSGKGVEKQFLDFFDSPGYSSQKYRNDYRVSERRFLTLVFPLKNKNDRVQVRSLSTSRCWSYSEYTVETENHKGEYPISLFADSRIMPPVNYDAVVKENDIKAYCIVAAEADWNSSVGADANKLLVFDDDNEGKNYEYMLTYDSYTRTEDMVRYAYEDCYCTYDIYYE